MKSKMILSLMPVLAAVFVMVGAEQAQAVDVGVGINIGGSSHYNRGRSVVRYRTADPVYTTWYPERTTYSYSPTYSSSYYDNGYGYGYGYSTPTTYVYSTNSRGYDGWYGTGRTGRGGYYSRDSRSYNRDGERRR